MTEVDRPTYAGLSVEAEQEFLEAFARLDTLRDRLEVIESIYQFRTGMEPKHVDQSDGSLEAQARDLKVGAVVLIYTQGVLTRELDAPRAVLQKVAGLS